MRTFKDNKKREWAVDVTVTTVKRVRDLVKVDLTKLVEERLIERLVADPVLLCDVVYAVCKPEADAKGISDEEFGSAMRGDAIDAATKALLDDLVDFSPSPGDRANLTRILEAARGAMDKARELIGAKIDSGELQKEVERELAKLGGLSGSAPESLASTPDPVPSAS